MIGTTFDSIVDPILIIDKDYTISDANSAFLKLIGKNLKDVVGKKCYELVHGKKEPIEGCSSCKAFKTKKTESFELYHPELKKHLLISSSPLKENGSVEKIVHHIRDVSEIKESEEALKESKEGYRKLIETSPDAIFVHIDQKIVFMNPAGLEILGAHNSSEVIGKSILDLTHPDYLEVIKRRQELLKKGEALRNEYFKAFRLDGSVIDVETTSARVTYQGKSAILSTIRDITERKKAEEALKESEELFSEFFEQGNIGAVITSLKKGFIRANQKFQDSLGYTEKELKKIKWAEMTHPEDLDADIKLWSKLLKGKIKSYELDKRFFRKDGSILYSHITVSCARNSDGSVKYTLATLQDITEKKKAEEEIYKNNILLQGILENTHMMAVYLDVKFNFLFVNKAYADTCKHPQDFFPGKNHFDLYPHKENQEIFQNVVDTGKRFYIEARPFEFPDQQERGITYWDWSLIPIKDSETKVIGLVFTLAEVTVRIRAGRELKENEEKLKLSMKSAREGMWEWDFTTDEAYFDDVCLQMLGYKPGEIKKKVEWWWTQWHPDDVAPTKKAVKDYLEGRAEKYSVEFRLRNKSGKYVWISSNGVVLRKDKNNKALYMIGIHQDISEIKETENTLKHSEEKIKNILESSPDSITVTDLEGNITECNEATLKLHGFSSKEEIIGKSALMFFPEREQERAIKNTEKVFKEGSVKNIEYTLLTKDGKEFPAELSASVINDVSGKPVSSVAITKDVTECKKTGKELEKLKDGLEIKVTERTKALNAKVLKLDKSQKAMLYMVEDLNRTSKDLKAAQEALVRKERLATLGQFSGSISHELRNPLGVIDSSVYYLKMRLKDADEKVSQHLERIKSSVNTSTSIIQSLLNLTRMKKPVMSKHELKSLVSDSINPSNVPDTVKVNRHFPEEEVLVHVEKEQIRMAIKNIVKNAVDAMKEKGTLTVTVQKDRDGRGEVCFQDTGSGIESDHIEKVFQPLFSTKAQGIGFGLSISRMIVENHEGTIRVESKPGQGAKFIISLPIYEEKVS